VIIIRDYGKKRDKKESKKKKGFRFIANPKKY